MATADVTGAESGAGTCSAFSPPVATAGTGLMATGRAGAAQDTAY